MLLAHVTGLDRTHFIAHADRPLADDVTARFDVLASRRRAGEPIAYIIGTREFYGMDFAVTPAVLIPRPETELLVDLALQRVAQGACRVLDLGTGSGAVAIAIAKRAPAAEVWAIDASAAALDVARGNARRHEVEVEWRQSDWFAALEVERFDVIVANPPYIAANDAHLGEGDVRFEPRAALVAGDDGLAEIRRIVAAAPGHLRATGVLYVEHGFDQGRRVRDLFVAGGYARVASHRDLARIERVTGGAAPAATR
jgi:release factor glutamine methyltransferase